jgi:cytochrome P450
VKRLEPLLRRRCAELVAELVPNGGCDLVSEFAIRVPTEMFLATLGLPVEDGPQFVIWVEKVFDGFFGIDVAGAAQAGAAIQAYFDAAIEERLRTPRDADSDFLTHMLGAEIDGEPLSRSDLRVICLTLMAAGLDTTRSMLGYVFHHFAQHPDQRGLIVADPARTPAAIEELIRLYPLVIMSGRLVKQDVDFHGVAMKAGDVVWLGLGSANRDPRKYENPNQFIPDRPHVRSQLAFAAGPHVCLGMHLARHELVVAVDEWHRQIPDYRITSPHTLMERGGGVLSLRSLPLRWD